MKVILTVGLIFISTLLIYSCGNNDSLTYAQSSKKIAEITCHNVFVCKEGESSRAIVGGDEATCTEGTEKALGNTCGDFKEDDANDCISCMEKLTCSQFFKEDGYEKYCTTCDTLCTKSGN